MPRDPERPSVTIFWFPEIHGSPPPKCFLGTGSHKPASNIQCTLEMIQDGEQWKTDRC